GAERDPPGLGMPLDRAERQAVAVAVHDAYAAAPGQADRDVELVADRERLRGGRLAGGPEVYERLGCERREVRRDELRQLRRREPTAGDDRPVVALEERPAPVRRDDEPISQGLLAHRSHSEEPTRARNPWHPRCIPVS